MAGLGGCPFAPGASGNLATGRLAAHLAEQGWDTGLDMAALARAEWVAAEIRESAHA